MKQPRRVRAWALTYPEETGDVFQIFTNAPAEIYATRKAAIENRTNESHKIVKVEIRQIKPRKRK
jgi:hypothetical protein